MDFAAARIDPNASNGTMASHGDDNGIFVEFEMRPLHLPFQSKQEGRPIFEDRPFITMMFPGDKTKKIERFAILDQESAGNGPTDPERFPRQWAAFQKNEAAPSMGLPVTEWPQITKSQAMELKAMNIHTVEAMAATPDGGLTWMGARDLREKAKAWIAAAKGHAIESKLAEENHQLQERLASMQAQMDEIRALHSGDAPKRGPGRPPKE